MILAIVFAVIIAACAAAVVVLARRIDKALARLQDVLAAILAAAERATGTDAR